jgi:hypothetical protein
LLAQKFFLSQRREGNGSRREKKKFFATKTRRREGARREEKEVEKKPRRFHLRSSKK